jgi:hypothetical protein
MTFFFLLIFCITLKLSLSIAATKLGCRSFFPFFVSLSNSSQKKKIEEEVKLCRFLSQIRKLEPTSQPSPISKKRLSLSL